MWWKHYNFSSEPYLSQEPLNTKEELDLFYGRETEIQKLKVILEGRYKRTLLFTGSPGVGKTSLINKLFYGNNGYIHVDLSKVKQFDDAEVVIAESCINTYSRYNKGKAKEFRKRLFSDISRTIGDSFKGGIAPGGIGVEYSGITQKTVNPIRNIEIVEVVKEVIQEINKKGNICMVLDESDFFDESHTNDLVHLSRRVKDFLPASSILVLINRDINNELEKLYQNAKSLVRSTFNNYYNVESAWKYGETDIQEVLKDRFKNALKLPDTAFPLSNKSCDFIDILSSGNFRILIQYLENVLKFGAMNGKKVPLEIIYVQEQIFSDYKEVVILSEQHERVLSFLKENPTHINDPIILDLYKRTSLQNIVKELEQRSLVSRNTKKPGVPQIYSTTLLGEIILNNAIVE